jgi:hypothetical protein
MHVLQHKIRNKSMIYKLYFSTEYGTRSFFLFLKITSKFRALTVFDGGSPPGEHQSPLRHRALAATVKHRRPDNSEISEPTFPLNSN